MPIHNRVSLAPVEFTSPEDQKKARLARMRHIVWLGVKNLERMAQEDRGQLVMYTLTYRGVKDWWPRDICACTRWLRSQGVSGYVWVGELQKRGAVHYHVLALLPEGQPWIKPTLEHGGWARGFTWVTPGIKHPLYIMKYLQKGDTNGTQTFFPKGFRLYAISRSIIRRFEFEDAVSYRRANIPQWAWSETEDSTFDLCTQRKPGRIVTRGLDAISPYTSATLPDVVFLNGEAYDRHITLCNQAQG